MAVLPEQKYKGYSLSNIQSITNGERPSPHLWSPPVQGIAFVSNYLKISCHAINF